MVVKRLLAGMGLFRRDIEGVVPRQIPLQLLQHLAVSQVEDLLEDQNAHHHPNRLVGPAVVRVEILGERVLVDQRQGIAVKLVSPRLLKPDSLGRVHLVFDAEQGPLGRCFAEHALL